MGAVNANRPKIDPAVRKEAAPGALPIEKREGVCYNMTKQTKMVISSEDGFPCVLRAGGRTSCCEAAF